MKITDENLDKCERRLNRMHELLNALDYSSYQHPRIYDDLTQEAQDLWDSIQYFRNEREYWNYKMQNEYGQLEGYYNEF